MPTPLNISYFWNFGSLLGINLILQFLTGIILAMFYSPNTLMSFSNIIHMLTDNNFLWKFQFLHSNGASMFFILMYVHIARGLFFQSYNLTITWILGVFMLFSSIATAFIGYVLPWGQMSFWGATVITNLLATIPFFGTDIVIWVWGGFSVDNPTLNRFFVFHFILPFLIVFLAVLHLIFLHNSGSNNPLGLLVIKISFQPYYIYKDVFGIVVFITIMFNILIISPFVFNDPDNFSRANPLNTPIHIQPEWYFLFAYAILRAIPNKLGGVIALILAIIILFNMRFWKTKPQRNNYFPLMKGLYWLLVVVFILLTWIGISPIETPFIQVGQILTIIYFCCFVRYPFVLNLRINLLK